jgi:hypothetical protein
MPGVNGKLKWLSMKSVLFEKKSNWFMMPILRRAETEKMSG